MKFSDTRGFSLPELMIVLSVLIIFATTAVPGLAALIDQHRASAYMQQFSQHLAYARVAATSSNLPVQVCPVSDTQCEDQWQQYPVQLAVVNPVSLERTVLRELPPVFARHKLSYNRSAVTFRRDGSLNGFENGTFYYCTDQGNNWHYRLTLNQAGRSRLTKVLQPCPN
jgi:type IV fimbrial biogenesis protein FimT